MAEFQAKLSGTQNIIALSNDGNIAESLSINQHRSNHPDLRGAADRFLSSANERYDVELEFLADAFGATDMRCGMNSLALKVQQGLGRDPHGDEVFCFRGRKCDLIKVLWHDGVDMSLYLKRLEAGKLIWPVSENGAAVQVSAAQLGYLLKG